MKRCAEHVEGPMAGWRCEGHVRTRDQMSVHSNSYSVVNSVNLSYIHHCPFMAHLSLARRTNFDSRSCQHTGFFHSINAVSAAARRTPTTDACPWPSIAASVPPLPPGLISVLTNSPSAHLNPRTSCSPFASVAGSHRTVAGVFSSCWSMSMLTSVTFVAVPGYKSKMIPRVSSTPSTSANQCVSKWRSAKRLGHAQFQHGLLMHVPSVQFVVRKPEKFSKRMFLMVVELESGFSGRGPLSWS